MTKYITKSFDKKKNVADQDILKDINNMKGDDEKMEKRVKYLWGKLRTHVKSKGALDFLQKKADESAS